MKKLTILTVLIFLVALSTMCTNPGKIRIAKLDIANAEKTSVDGIDAVKICLKSEARTNPNVMVAPPYLKTWFGIGNPNILERFTQIKGEKINLCYRSIDEEQGLIMIISFETTI